MIILPVYRHISLVSSTEQSSAIVVDIRCDRSILKQPVAEQHLGRLNDQIKVWQDKDSFLRQPKYFQYRKNPIHFLALYS